MQPNLSVVVPCLNEESSLPHLVRRLQADLPSLVDGFEVLMVDDGSTDRTLELMRAVNADDPRFRYLSLSRNFGKESAMLAGLTQARGRAVTIMDADLQHPPSVLAQMLPHLDEGYEQVVARRTRVKDPAVRRTFSKLYYRAMNKLVDVRLSDGEGDFRLLSRTAVAALLSLGEYNRFSKGLYSWIGFRTAVVEYDNQSRTAGRSRWSMRALVNYGIDGVLSFNSRPLRMAIWFGLFVTVVALGYAITVLGDAILNGNPVPGYVTTICIVVAFGGAQMMMLGIIGEYLGRIYLESKGRPHFLVRESSDPLTTPVTVQLGTDYGHEQPATYVQM